MTDFDAGDLAAADEVLQILYWLRGEGLAADAAVADLQRLLAGSEQGVREVLDRLVRLGLVAHRLPADRYTLTELGVREGGRRFADEFADITKPGHGECGDPECDCHRTGSPADCAHRH